MQAYQSTRPQSKDLAPWLAAGLPLTLAAPRVYSGEWELGTLVSLLTLWLLAAPLLFGATQLAGRLLRQWAGSPAWRALAPALLCAVLRCSR